MDSRFPATSKSTFSTNLNWKLLGLFSLYSLSVCLATADWGWRVRRGTDTASGLSSHCTRAILRDRRRHHRLQRLDNYQRYRERYRLPRRGNFRSEICSSQPRYYPIVCLFCGDRSRVPRFCAFAILAINQLMTRTIIGTKARRTNISWISVVIGK